MVLKRLLLGATFCVMVATKGFSKEKVKGYFISHGHDTVQVTFLLPQYFLSDDLNLDRVQYKVQYLDTVTGKAITLKPWQALGIGFTF